MFMLSYSLVFFYNKEEMNMIKGKHILGQRHQSIKKFNATGTIVNKEKCLDCYVVTIEYDNRRYDQNVPIDRFRILRNGQQIPITVTVTGGNTAVSFRES